MAGIGEDYWGNGYGTEAAKSIIEFVFTEKNYHRVHGRHLKSNPVSGKIMKKCGMMYEGTLKDHIYKNDDFEDIVFYGLINSIKITKKLLKSEV
ncbi:GNAT family N-acetyltransferase [Bacillus sp. CRN 9]|nr:GNAT family N-acetyltransferase [Bacillus sp. CRN 9]